MKKYEIPQIIFKLFNCESILTASGKASSEEIVTQMLEQNGASVIKSVKWEDMW